MISTTTFTSEQVLDDALPKIACLIAIPAWLMVLHAFVVFWQEFLNQVL